MFTKKQWQMVERLEVLHRLTDRYGQDHAFESDYDDVAEVLFLELLDTREYLIKAHDKQQNKKLRQEEEKD